MTAHQPLAAAPASGKVPPGPRGNRLLGVAPELVADPLALLTRIARTYGDVARYRVANQVMYQVSHPDGVKQILQDNNRNYSKAGFKVGTLKLLIGSGLFMSDGEFWLRQRRLMQPPFHRQHLIGMGETMVAAAQEVAGAWEGAASSGKPVDVAADMMGLTLNVATLTLFSTRVKADMGTLGAVLTAALEDVSYRYRMPIYPPVSVPTPRNRRFIAAQAKLDQVILGIIDERRGMLERGDEAPEDLLTLLIQVRDEDTGEGMTRSQLRDEVMTLFVAGHETTAVTLSWCFYLIGQHPEVEAKLHAEWAQVLGGRAPTVADLRSLTFTRMVVDEALRLYPPAWITQRTTIAPDEVCGYRIQAGFTVLISPWVLHRDPRWWPEPEEFRPERFAQPDENRPKLAYMPFGAGPRLCLGRDLALMEAPLVLATLGQRYRVRSQPGYQLALEPLLTLRPRGGLPMTVEPRA